MNEFKKCPYCGEVILAEAKKCKYCREWLSESPVGTNNGLMRKQTLQNEHSEYNKYNQEVRSVGANQQQPIVNVYTTNSSKQQRNGIGLTGFIMSLLCLVTSWAPIVNIVMWILGFVFSAVGLFKKPKGFAIAGMVISLISILLIILLFVILGELASDFLGI